MNRAAPYHARLREVSRGLIVDALQRAHGNRTLAAEDLGKMEVHTNVAEADVGRISAGMAVEFGVDAYPTERFRGVVREIRYAPQTVQNVVTYDAVVSVENAERKLRPGMTATAEIVTTSIEDAVLVPNAALRFTPEGADLGTPNAQQQRGPLSALMPQMRRPGGQQQGGAMRRFGRAWIVEDGKPALVLFRSGATDGRMTQVLEITKMPAGGPMANNETFRKALERKLEPGMQVIVDAEKAKP